jgi:excinuclease UvrABC ATPase subunit
MDVIKLADYIIRYWSRRSRQAEKSLLKGTPEEIADKKLYRS